MAVLTVADDEDALARAAAERLTTLLEQAVQERGSATLSLTGGTTPQRLYALLADPALPWRTRIDWQRLHLFWGDERHVPPDHKDSNFGMANGAMIRHVPIPPQQVHRMRGEVADAHDAAGQYGEALRAGFAAAGRTDYTFDVMLLGLGEDAHIASIFPRSELLRRPVSSRAAAIWASHLNAWRITLTPAAILDSRAIVMVVAGASKAEAVRAAIEEPENTEHRPAQLLRAAGDRLEWFIDRAAATRLSPPPSPAAPPA